MAHVGPSCDSERVATNLSFEDAGVGQGSADGWTTTTAGAAQEYPSIERGDGLLVAWESFSGWAAGQADYRFTGFDGGDTTAAALETFQAWLTGQDEYRAAGFESGDTSGGATEGFGAWVTGMGDYRFGGFEPGDTTAAALETFAAWVINQAEYRAAFDPGDTSTATFQLGPGATGETETFAACRSDVAVQSTASSTTIAATGHAFLVNDPVQLTANGPLFAPFQKGITYYVKTIVASVSVTLAATPGGSAITATETGEGTLIGDPAYFWRNPRSAW